MNYIIFMNTKSSAYYQREYRKRLREQGLVKREVWIRPEHVSVLSAVEKKLRHLGSSSLVELSQTTGVSFMSETSSWTTERLYLSLKESELGVSGGVSIELIEGIDPAVHITMHDYGDLPVFLTVAGEQIIVESVLWEASEVSDVVGFNEAVLRTHKYFPLSTISLDKIGDGLDYYHMFGALSSMSSLQNVVFEIEVLANNVIQATSAYSGFLKASPEA